MATVVRGVYRQGRVELIESPGSARDDAPVVVTFLEPGEVDLRQIGVDEATALEWRQSMASFAEDWEAPEMAVYDNYDANKPA